MPYANDGGSSWNATKCSPIAPDPAAPGEPCSVEGNGVSGIDTCEKSAMCWYVDPKTNEGICVAFCEGSESNPTCDEGFVCPIYGDGLLILCLPTCNPLYTPCPYFADHVCVPHNDEFLCAPDLSGDMGAYGDPCEFINVCDPGLFCANADAVPGCVGSLGCCSEFCDLSDPLGAAQCSGAAEGQECLPWYEQGQAPMGYENLGACALPS